MPENPKRAAYNLSEAEAIKTVKAEILRRIPKGETPEEFFTGLIRRALDEILSLSERSFRIDQLDPPEQTYVGTRSEVLVRDALDVGVGSRADAYIAGHEVDLKWSRKLNWMIGPENLGLVCLGLGTDGSMRKASVGLFIPRADRLGAQNRDDKFTAGAGFRREFVDWIVHEADLPPNFIETLPDEMRDDIMSRGSAQDRMRRLAERLPYTPIPRSALRFVSLNKDDFMRRIREDANRVSPPLGDMVCLSWKYRKDEVARLGFELKRNEFLFVKRSDLGTPSK